MFFMRKEGFNRKLGYKTDQEGIMSRYMREVSAWTNHLEQTKGHILKSARQKSKGSAVILGSGWLLDVPYIELSKMFEQVYFVDILHPSQIKHKCAKFANLNLIEHDITGGLAQWAELAVIECKKNKTNELITMPALNISNFGLSFEADFYVSVNILNQLDILIIDYLKRNSIRSGNDFCELRTKIQAAHIGALPHGKSCLISDYEELQITDSNQVVSVKQLIHTKIPNLETAEQWLWKFDNSKSYNSNYNTHFRVLAVEF